MLDRVVPAAAGKLDSVALGDWAIMTGPTDGRRLRERPAYEIEDRDLQTPFGRWLRLSPNRVMICDLLHFAKQVPTNIAQRRMKLDRLISARRQATLRPGWCVSFTKAFAAVATEFPQLRRSYMKFPWPHIFEHGRSVASVAVERTDDQEPELFFAKLPDPAQRRLGALDRYLKKFARTPGMNSKAARIGLRMTWLPRPLRHFVWWWSINVLPWDRANEIGTFGVTVYSALGAEAIHPLSPTSFVLTYGPIDEQGGVDVRIIYDHRIIDGATVARALSAIETQLNGAIADELLRAGKVGRSQRLAG